MNMNPHAIYVRSDGSLDYGPGSTGGYGYQIEFSEYINIDDVEKSFGPTKGFNIETLELMGLDVAIKDFLRISRDNKEEVRKANEVYFLVDRFALADTERLSLSKIAYWRKNGWKTSSGSPVKNKDLIDSIDKNRKKIGDTCLCPVRIKYISRKKNKAADKLAKAGKRSPGIKHVSRELSKIHRRLHDGDEVIYVNLKKGQALDLHIFKKTSIGCGTWEVSADIVSQKYFGRKIKLHISISLERSIHRGHSYSVVISSISKYFIEIDESRAEEVEE